MTDTEKTLTLKQQRFVEEYLVDLNATQAAIRAGYSEKTAKSIGQENLTPILADRSGRVVARGHNLRVQTGDPTAHAEVVCIRNAGRRRDWNELVLVSTLSPCVMCTGTALLYRIPHVIIGENQNFMGAENLFLDHGVRITILKDPACIQLMRDFVREHAEGGRMRVRTLGSEVQPSR